jgi:ABC-type nickel/cobalt efflux system permease component RcnA
LNSAEFLLIGAVLAVGVLHTMVPDHWLPIALMARQQKWSARETALAALQAGIGHVVSTLLIAVLFWGAGAVIATRFSGWVEIATSAALVGFGLWVAVGAWWELAHENHQDHGHDYDTKRGSRLALLLILGSSPMIEGIPVFFAAGRYGVWLLVIMALVFAAATTGTYVILSVYLAQGLRQVRFGRFERYGEIGSGLIIAAVGIAFWVWPVV